MTKVLKNILEKLEGVKASKVEDGNVGDLARNDDKDKRFIAQHKVVKHADRVGAEQGKAKTKSNQGDKGHRSIEQSKTAYKAGNDVKEETIDEGNKANKLKKKDWLDPKKREKPKFKSNFDPRSDLKKEEVEIDEVSKSTLVSYKKKITKALSKNQPSDPKKLLKRNNREAGDKLAAKKIMNYKVKVAATEEVEIDEAKSKAGYQLWPGDKKKKFFNGPKDKDGKTETQKWAEKRAAERAAKAAAVKEDVIDEADVPYNHGKSKATFMDTPVASRADGSGTYYKLSRGRGGESKHHVIYTKGGKTIQAKTEKSALKKLDAVKEDVIDEGRVGPSSGNRSGGGLSFGVSKNFTKEPGQNQRIRQQFAPKTGIKNIIKDRMAKLTKEDVDLEENLGAGMKKYKFWNKSAWDNGDPRNVKKRLKDMDKDTVKSIATDTGKKGGAGELQRRLAKKMTKEETDASE